MPNNQAHDPRVSTAPERVAAPVGLTVAAVASGGALAGFTPQSGFTATTAGFTGDTLGGIQFLYSDGTTSATVGVTISVVDGVVVFGRVIGNVRCSRSRSNRRYPARV